MMRHPILRPPVFRAAFNAAGLLLVLPLALSACTAIEPYTREGSWRPSGANDRNLTAMVADPRDIQRGVGANTALGETSAAAVDRLITDRVRALPSSQTTHGMGGTAGGGAAQ